MALIKIHLINPGIGFIKITDDQHFIIYTVADQQRIFQFNIVKIDNQGQFVTEVKFKTEIQQLIFKVTTVRLFDC